MGKAKPAAAHKALPISREDEDAYFKRLSESFDRQPAHGIRNPTDQRKRSASLLPQNASASDW